MGHICIKIYGMGILQEDQFPKFHENLIHPYSRQDFNAWLQSSEQGV
jgi:hypothetical protein